MSKDAYDGKVTEEQVQELEKKRLAYFTAKEQGSDEAPKLGVEYHDYATSILIDLSGKLDPLPDLDPNKKPEKPTEGTPKQGGNQDPETWHVVPMKDDPSKFKIIDDDGKNIATDFTTAESAVEYINYYRWEKQQQQPSGDGGQQPPPPAPTGDKDSFGIAKICPDADAGRFLTNFKIEYKTRNYRSGKPSEPSMEYTSKAGNDANDGGSAVKNQEVTWYARINKFKKEDDTFSTKILGGAHSSSDGGKGGTCYDVQINVHGGTANTLQVERPHPSMHPCHQKALFKIGETLVGKWIGVKTICYLINNGKDRRIEQHIDYPVPDIEKPPNAWRKYWAVDDTGQLPKGHIVQPIGSLTTVRLDGVPKDGIEFRYASVREIKAG